MTGANLPTLSEGLLRGAVATPVADEGLARFQNGEVRDVNDGFPETSRVVRMIPEGFRPEVRVVERVDFFIT